MYNFEYIKGQGLQVKIDEEELKEMMEQDNFDTAEYLRRKCDDENYKNDLNAEYPEQRIHSSSQKHFERG